MRKIMETWDNACGCSNFSNASGYGFWCGEKCVAKKQAAGIQPLGYGQVIKKQNADTDAKIADAMSKQEGLSPLFVGGIVLVALAGLGTLVYFSFIRKKK